MPPGWDEATGYWGITFIPRDDKAVAIIYLGPDCTEDIVADVIAHEVLHVVLYSIAGPRASLQLDTFDWEEGGHIGRART